MKEKAVDTLLWELIWCTVTSSCRKKATIRELQRSKKIMHAFEFPLVMN